MPEITFVGTGEAFDPDLPNTSVLYRGDRTLLLDCGYSVPQALWRMTRDPDLIDAIWSSHSHADHSFGIPALLLWMRVGGRTRPLTVFGGPGVGKWLAKLLDLAYPGGYDPARCFAIEAVEVGTAAPVEFGDLRLRAARSDHGVRNLALRIDEGDSAFAYSGDGAPTEATRALYGGVGVLVHECHADRDPYAGHGGAEAVVAMAAQLGVATLCVLHVAVDQKAAVAARVAQSEPGVTLPAPGDRLDLGRGCR